MKALKQNDLLSLFQSHIKTNQNLESKLANNNSNNSSNIDNSHYESSAEVVPTVLDMAPNDHYSNAHAVNYSYTADNVYSGMKYDAQTNVYHSQNSYMPQNSAMMYYNTNPSMVIDNNVSYYNQGYYTAGNVNNNNLISLEYPTYPVKTPKPKSTRSTGSSAVRKEVSDKPIKDGFRWRKYGQKSVKNSPFPRSYYKCTVTGCTAKKQVEKFIDESGEEKLQTSFIGEHIHPAPEFNRIFVESQSAFIEAVNKFFSGSENGQKNTSKRKRDGSSTRRLEVQSAKGIIVHEDGYNWRKYGQKNVKGSSYPRAYFKCTHSATECSVRKMVEETDNENYICIYEGSHNHSSGDDEEFIPSKRPKFETSQEVITNETNTNNLMTFSPYRKNQYFETVGM
eukprot:TRINITY_DN11391_c0_g1_i1.p1 TRINITY_DN11391_c0_g1~~TRINITY_DN11391_c0_g1_i1.p1  ORF type:complete len:395 (+),score=73.95 TRINITY_DN11391_c0_g1_i1:1-1185(+)